MVKDIYIDGKKHATLTVTELNGKYYKNTIMEEHYIVVRELRSFISPMQTLLVISSDGIASITGTNREAIRCVKKMIGRPLKWSICLLHANGLLLKHIFLKLNESTVEPNAFSGPIEKNLVEPISNWEVLILIKLGRPIPNLSFLVLPQPLIEDLSIDHYYSYRIC